MKENDIKTAVVLGGTLPHGELLKKLKERGYRTVLVDYFADPPAARFADVHCRESAMDHDAVLKIAREYQADLVLSSCLDQQMNIAMKVAEELGLPHPFSSQTAEMVTNKRLMKKIMMDNGVPTARYYVVDRDLDVTKLELSDDIIVKPVDSCGSAGISRLRRDDPAKFKEALDKACGFGLAGRAIVEDYLEGTEMSVHCVRNGGKMVILYATCKIPVIDRGISRQLGNVYFPKLNEVLQAKLEKAADQIGTAFGLPDDTPFFMQVMVCDGDPFVIEFSPRIAGGISSLVAERYLGFDLLGYSIDSYLGRHQKLSNERLNRFIVCLPVYASEGIYKETAGIRQLQEDGTVSDVLYLKDPGEEVHIDKPSSSCVLKYVIEADSIEECYERIRKADRLTKVLDQQDNDIRLGRNELTEELFYEKVRPIYEG